MKFSEYKTWWPLLLVIPFVFGLLWIELGTIGISEIVIASVVIISAFGFLYYLNRNKDED
ncbi:MAG TPA: hypothetical protein VJ949_01720 [Cryomorphaceae bacterium]|nr:hypothetical protein [Cryomorphaceae bacterium]HKL40473.1 hypothetical protein [Cryomorphaceae bacterium]